MPPDDPIFAMSPSSTEFLVTNHFDFNKLIEGGIPFMNREREDYYKSIGFGPYSKVPEDVGPYSSFRDEIELRRGEDKKFVSDAMYGHSCTVLRILLTMLQCWYHTLEDFHSVITRDCVSSLEVWCPEFLSTTTALSGGSKDVRLVGFLWTRTHYPIQLSRCQTRNFQWGPPGHQTIGARDHRSPQLHCFCQLPSFYQRSWIS